MSLSHPSQAAEILSLLDQLHVALPDRVVRAQGAVEFAQGMLDALNAESEPALLLDASPEEISERFRQIVDYRRNHQLLLDLTRELVSAAEYEVFAEVRASAREIVDALRKPYRLAGRDLVAAADALKPFEVPVLNSSEFEWNVASIAEDPAAAKGLRRANAAARKMDLIIRVRQLLGDAVEDHGAYPELADVWDVELRRFARHANRETLRLRPMPASGALRWVHMQRWTGCDFVLQDEAQMIDDWRTMQPRENAVRRYGVSAAVPYPQPVPGGARAA